MKPFRLRRRQSIINCMYVHACEWHDGQWSKLYRRLCFLQRFVSSRLQRMGRQGLSYEELAIYDRIVARHESQEGTR